ncbi:MAG: phosphoribosylamine--glycine ligase [Pirellulaceae bacterium]|jgi:phosphoribosylamine--glycine ligase|nr:phosphoribosylamine--glycine ligase [Thermoguttaceae bacterium]MDI9443178.1 phosphoribosylamine--glycine ligase [Planctomycetota bacterium]NLY99539.1 phosphoribosylamine--glycine ligase [Pirellulaceae bacterium]
MKVLVIGGGGREHALAWRVSQSPRVSRVFVAPGNAGTAEDAENVEILSSDFAGLIQFARQNNVGLTVVGPEAPLATGLVDAFQREGLRVFGPNKAAAQLEASKVFCRDLLRNADVPGADYRTFRNADDAIRYLNEREDSPIVVKADGLAAGKGVVVCTNRQDALDAVNQIARQKVFGPAGDRLLIEERLGGEEASVLAITDGRTIVTLQPAQDHKPAYDGDTGPNTGGMGAYCPTPLIDDERLHWIEEHVLVPTVHAMKRAGRPFYGVLYAGMMITNQGPRVLEFNVRFGDPECQPLLMRLKTDLVDLLEAAVDQRLDEIESLVWDTRPAVCVVMASKGYPGAYETGFPIRGLEEAAKIPGVKVFHAGTALKDGKVISAGGRVLNVTALGDSIPKAKLQAYTAVKAIRWDGAWCRKDISDKAIRHASRAGM